MKISKRSEENDQREVEVQDKMEKKENKITSGKVEK